MNFFKNGAARNGSQLLRDFGPAYFDHVLAQFELFKEKNAIPPYIEAIVDTYARTPDQLRWRDIYALEEFVLQMQPGDVVRARAPGLEEYYKEVVGTRPDKSYLKMENAPNQDGLLKVALSRLLDTLHWVYSMIPERERMRSSILIQSGKGLLLSIVVLVPIILVCGFKGQTLLATVSLVALMGSLGGFLSLQRRLQNLPLDRDPLLTMLELQNGRFTVSLAPLLGAIFAVVLFLIFSAGLLKGPMFPEQLSFGPWKLGQGIDPTALANVGKLLLWSFIAGFAEKFVPDTLDRIASKGSQPVKAKPVEEAVEASERKMPKRVQEAASDPTLKKSVERGESKSPSVATGNGQGAQKEATVSGEWFG